MGKEKMNLPLADADREYLGHVFVRNLKPILHWCLRLTRNADADAQDLAQETFLRLARRVQKKGQVNHEKAYLAKIARNTWWRRKEQWLKTVDSQRDTIEGDQDELDNDLAQDHDLGVHRILPKEWEPRIPGEIEDERLNSLRLKLKDEYPGYWEILWAWANGMTLEQMAAETGESLVDIKGRLGRAISLARYKAKAQVNRTPKDRG